MYSYGGIGAGYGWAVWSVIRQRERDRAVSHSASRVLSSRSSQQQKQIALVSDLNDVVIRQRPPFWSGCWCKSVECRCADSNSEYDWTSSSITTLLDCTVTMLSTPTTEAALISTLLLIVASAASVQVSKKLKSGTCYSASWFHRRLETIFVCSAFFGKKLAFSDNF